MNVDASRVLACFVLKDCCSISHFLYITFSASYKKQLAKTIDGRTAMQEPWPCILRQQCQPLLQ